MKILLHSLVFSPDSVSTAYLMADLVRQLKSLGHSITVITTTPHYNLDGEALKRQPLKVFFPGIIYQSNFHDIKVWHVKVPMKGKRVLSRIFDYLFFHTISIIIGFFFVGPYDIVIAPSPPLSIGVIGWLLALRRGVPFVYNVQEIYPDVLFNYTLVKQPIIVKALRHLERFVYKRSKMIVTISDCFSQVISERGVPSHKIQTIPNFVDTEVFRPLPRNNAFAKGHNLLDSFVVLYGGNIGVTQDWETLLYTAESLSDLPILFFLIGDGAKRKWLEQEITKRKLQNIRLSGFYPRETVPEINASSDICTIPLKAKGAQDTLPSKIYTIMASSKPLIVAADENSELANIVKTSQCGWVVPPDDKQAYLTALLDAFHQRERLNEIGERGRAFVMEEYSKEIIAQKYHTLIDRLTKGSRFG